MSMNAAEFATVQIAAARPELSSLVERCARKYLQAADLLDARRQTAERMREALGHERSDFSPLLPFWGRICERYRAELFDPQDELFERHDDVVLEKWRVFVHRRLFSMLCRENFLVRSVLGAVNLLPSKSPRQAVETLILWIEDLALPTEAPARDDEDLV